MRPLKKSGIYEVTYQRGYKAAVYYENHQERREKIQRAPVPFIETNSSYGGSLSLESSAEIEKFILIVCFFFIFLINLNGNTLILSTGSK